MSVALEDHGEIVPRRGTTSSARPAIFLRGMLGPYASRRSNVRIAVAASAAETSTKWTYSAYRSTTPGFRAASAWSRFFCRAGESAGEPGIESMGLQVRAVAVSRNGSVVQANSERPERSRFRPARDGL